MTQGNRWLQRERPKRFRERRAGHGLQVQLQGKAKIQGGNTAQAQQENGQRGNWQQNSPAAVGKQHKVPSVPLASPPRPHSRSSLHTQSGASLLRGATRAVPKRLLGMPGGNRQPQQSALPLRHWRWKRAPVAGIVTQLPQLPSPFPRHWEAMQRALLASLALLIQ